MNSQFTMPRRTIAKINWLSVTEGGRQHPPSGPRYSTLARFEKESTKWPEIAWSIVADFKNESDSSSIEVEISFLSPDAPLHLLEPGNKFELYEGRRLVARGEVLKIRKQYIFIDTLPPRRKEHLNYGRKGSGSDRRVWPSRGIS